MTKFGIGIGRNTHTLVTFHQDAGGDVVIKHHIPNDHSGVMKVVELVSGNNSPKQVVFTGNVRWGTPFAGSLKDQGVEPLYFRFLAERGQRGRVGNVAESLVKVFTSGAQARPYFLHRSDLSPEEMAAEEAERWADLPTSHRLALEYCEVTNEVRRVKHHVLDGLVILFPECVKSDKPGTADDGDALPVPEPQPPGLFTKGMMRVLDNPDPFELENDPDVPEAIQTLAARSLGRSLPSNYRAQVMASYLEHLRDYRAQLVRKESKMDELRAMMSGHPLLAHYGDGDIMTVVAAFIGWRQWPNWRELRHYCGLDVSRMDSKGKLRISRVRPPIRQYLYLFMTMTKVGREIAAEVETTRPDGTRRKHLRVKRLEHLLKALRQTCLKG
mgnify:CR=1 FL=1